MSGPLADSVSTILAQLLVDLGIGYDPPQTGNTPWEVHHDNEPDEPDNCLTTYDTTGIEHGRSGNDDVRMEHHGTQIRIRATDHDTGWVKARAIAVRLDKVKQTPVHVLNNETSITSKYIVWTIIRKGDVMRMGKEASTDRRLFSINSVMAVYQVA